MHPFRWLILFAAALPVAAQTTVVDFPGFGGTDMIKAQGAALVEPSRIALAAGKPGGAWFHTKRFLADGFETSFSVRANAGTGFAFVIQNGALPSLGYEGLAVEFTPGQIRVANIGSAPMADIFDGAAHTVRISYRPGTLEVFAGAPVLNLALDLSSVVALDNGQAWFGFKANSTAAHEILSWRLDTSPGAVTASIIAPLNGASFVSPATIDLAAEALTTNGAIARVEFFADARKIAEGTNTPFAAAWDNVAPGVYLLRAVAYNEAGQSSVSPPVEVTVLPSIPSVGIDFAVGTNAQRYVQEDGTRAGLLPQRYWNSITASTTPNLRNALGEITTIDVSIPGAVQMGEIAPLNADLDGDFRLMKAHLSLAQVATNNITVSQVPFNIYDVIIYSDGDNDTVGRVAQFRYTTNNVFLRDAPGADFAGIYAQATGGAEQGTNTSTGNYVRFNGIISNSFTIFFSARSSTDGNPRAAINAIQILPSVYSTEFPPQITRGPYLNSGGQTSIVVRWRTNRPVNERVRYGTNQNNLQFFADDLTETIEHTMLLTNLQPDTKYFYSIGTTETNLLSGPSYFFWTAPSEPKPTRIWVLGDAGTANANQMAVRDAYMGFTGTRYTDVMLMLGDNAYNTGTDAEHQRAVFDMYPETLRQTVVWPTIGNHETAQSHNPPMTIPYFQIFDLPRNGEGGGVPSGTEKYYSFTYGDVHFVCLDSMTSDRSTNGVMADWLRADLDVNTAKWIVAFFHHPPYSKGHHDSDDPNGADFELKEMRERIIPILESYGVDIVLSGHTHAYERSFFLHGHYGHSSTLEPSMKLNPGGGGGDDAPYVKVSTTPVPYAGTVYAVAGSSGQTTSAPLNHPAMFISLLTLGSMVLDVDGDVMQAKFLDSGGEIADEFSIIKQTPAAQPLAITEVGAPQQSISFSFSAQVGKTYRIQCATNLANPVWVPVSENITATDSRIHWSHPRNPNVPVAFYRIVAVTP